MTECPNCKAEDMWPNRDTPEGVLWFCAACGADFVVPKEETEEAK